VGEWICIFSKQALKILLKNYLGVDLDDSVLKELEKVIEMARMTPVDISEVLIKNRRKKEKVVDELWEILKVNAERNGKNGGVREKDDEEEEQEKRALDSDSPKQESEIKDDFKEGLLEEEEKIK
jgi:chaperone BCS1